MRRFLLALALLWPSASWAVNPMCPTRPFGDSTNACASTAFTTTGIAANFASPPALGNITPNTVFSTTLSATGAVSGAGFTALFASPPPIGSTASNTIAATSLFSTSFGIGSSAFVGDGATSNNTAWQNALIAVSSGGILTIPCGKYKITSSASFTVASGASAIIHGSGSECTKIYYAGTSISTTATVTDKTSGITFEGLSFTTNDATGSNTAINLVGSDTGYGAPSVFRDVTIRGDDGFGITDYFGTGLNVISASFVDYDNLNFYGNSTSHGVGVNITSVAAKPAQIHNFTGGSTNLCNKGIIYGNLVQGVTVTAWNTTGCNFGIIAPVSETGLDQLAITSSQFNCFTVCIEILSALPGFSLTNSLFVVQPGSIGIEVEGGTAFTIGHNQLGGVSGTTTGLHVTTGNNGTFTGNWGNGLTNVISLDSGANGLYADNRFLSSGLTNSSSSAFIYDNVPDYFYTIAGLPTCNTAAGGVTLKVSNGAGSPGSPPAYMSAVSATGTSAIKVLCDTANWRYD